MTNPTTADAGNYDVIVSGTCTPAVTSVAVVVSVNQKSSDPTSATASASTIFYGQSTSLTLNGGGGGTGTVIKWYNGSCGGALVGTGNNLNVTPSASTTYFGRYEDPAPCGPPYTICQSVLITVTDRLTISKSITQTPLKPGDAFSYQISYQNLNTSVQATGVIIKDILPAANYFTNVSTTPVYTSFDTNTRLMIWNIGNLAPLATSTITITGRLGSSGISNWPVYDPTSYYISTGSSGPSTLNNLATIESSTVSDVSSNTVTNSVVQYCGYSIQMEPASGYIKQSSPSFYVLLGIYYQHR